MEWKSKNPNLKSADITVDNLAEAFKWLDSQSNFFDPWFTATPDPTQAKSRFSHAIDNAQPALRGLFHACCKARAVAIEASCKTHEFMNQVDASDGFDIAATLEVKTQSHAFISGLTLAEANASSWFVHANEIVEALAFELLQETRWLGIGNRRYGVALSDLLRACANFVRHKSEMALNLTRAHTPLVERLRARQLESLGKLGRILSHQTEFESDEEASLRVFQFHEPMMSCLFELAGFDTQSESGHNQLLDELRQLGAEMIDQKWDTRKAWH